MTYSTLKNASLTMFDNLMEEVRAINAYLGTDGVLDALMYIQAHESEWEGTIAHKEYKAFMKMGQKMFSNEEASA